MTLKSAIHLARFQTTNHKLPIEKGNWNDARTAHGAISVLVIYVIKQKLLGDEYHFLLECGF